MALGEVVLDTEFPAAGQAWVRQVWEAAEDAEVWVPLGLKRSVVTVQCRAYDIPLLRAYMMALRQI